MTEDRSLTSKLNDIQKEALVKGIDLQTLPSYLAIIMDGNGRWAKRLGLDRLAGHYQGYETLRDIVLIAGKLGVRYLTVYGFSTENWRRPSAEVEGLMHLYEYAAKEELERLQENNVRMRLTGRIWELPEPAQKALLHNVEMTKTNIGLTFTIALNYGGRAEVVDAVKHIVEQKIPVSDITEELIQQHLYQPDFPELDLMIRTSGEMRWSNFLMWQSAYAELYVTPTLWPDFGQEEFFEAILKYQKRQRRFGGI